MSHRVKFFSINQPYKSAGGDHFDSAEQVSGSGKWSGLPGQVSRGRSNRQICKVATLGNHNLSCAQFRLKS